MRDSHVESMSVYEVRENLTDLVTLIAQGRKRVEIPTGSGDVVLISKAELEALERALSIMAETSEFKTIAHSLHRIAAATAEQPIVA